MSTPSNLYAEKVFAEHPTGLWAFDDKVDYVSLISEADRDLSNGLKWTITGGTVSEYPQSVDEPFINSQVHRIVATPTNDESASIVAVSEEIMNLKDLNTYLKTFCIGSYFYSESSYIAGFEIGYRYENQTSGDVVTHLKSYDTVINNSWVFVSETFDTPPDDAMIRLIFKINFIGGSETEDAFLVNGITFGQWSEEFSSTSLGIIPTDIPSTIAIAPQKGVVAKCYGLQELNGYYLVSDKMLKAKNLGIPIVYGTSSLTALYPNGVNPSIIIPGLGFLNESGKFKQYTLETWLRINAYTNDRKRIIGPISSDDGIYVDGPSIGLKIGSEYKTYYVGEWTRPMLVHLRLGKDVASLVINGQEVISFDYDPDTLDFPEMMLNGKEQDWIGFYAHEDVFPIDIDCVAIYPYVVPTAVTKRKFVFGQGVEIPENINTSYSGTSVFIDYAFADYSANYQYPKIGSWQQAFNDNTLIQSKGLSVSKNPLPQILLSSKTQEELFSSNDAVQSSDPIKFFSFRPDTTWDNVSGHMLFENFDFLKSSISAFYGCFRLPQSSPQTQTLFRIEKENSSSYFAIELKNSNIFYKNGIDNIKIDKAEAFMNTTTGVVNTLYTTSVPHQLLENSKVLISKFEKTEFNKSDIHANIFKIVSSNSFTLETPWITLQNVNGVFIKKYSDGPQIKGSGVLDFYTTVYSPLVAESGELADIGLNIPSFVARFGERASDFFGSLSDLRLYVGGDKLGNSTFTGKIYKIGFCTKYNFQKIRGLFNELGVPIWNQDLFDEYQNNELINIDGGIDTTSVNSGGPTSTVQGAISGGGVFVEEEDALIDHVASYTLSPNRVFGNYKLSVSANAYWEDQIPLTYFAESVIDKRGDQYFDLDFIQFNIDYPVTSKTIAIETDPVDWTYAELANEYGLPVQRTYESLDNYLFTGYNDYEDLKNKIAKDYRYDTDGAIVKSYVTFQYTELGANATPLYFTKTERPSRNGILVPGSDWMTTRYEVVDNMIIYPPAGVDFNDLSLVTHIDMNIKDSDIGNVIIKKLSYASQALNESDASPIGTRFGTPIYPYTKTGIYYDFKKQNPFSIYSGSSSYLYLTKTSGIQVRGKYDPLVNRGLLIPINTSRSNDFKAIAMQMAVRFDGDYFPYAPTQIFEIESKTAYIKFYMVASDPSGRRAKIYAIDAKTGLVQNGIGFYWNGKIVKEPVLTLQEWGFLGISFADSLIFSSFEGAIRLTGPLLFNSISYYQSTNLQEVQNVSDRPWFRVKVLSGSTLDWEFWDSPSFNWNKVLILAEKSFYGVDPSEIYKSYTGTNKVIVGDDTPVVLKDYEYAVYTDVNWNRYVVDPV
jgi:hypothetical protein